MASASKIRAQRKATKKKNSKHLTESGGVKKKRPSDKRRNNNPYNAVEYKIYTAVNTGELRDDAFQKLNLAAFTNDYDTFEPVRVHATRPTIIRCAKDNSIIAVHLPAMFLRDRGVSTKYIAELIDIVEDLPHTKSTGTSARGLHDSRSYQMWVGSKRDPIAVAANEKKTGLLGLSGDYLNDGEKGRRLVSHCRLLWKVLGTVHDQMFPREGGVLERYILSERAVGEFLAHPWPGMAINRGHTNLPVETIPHKDTKNAFFSTSPLFAFGDYSGGDVVFWEHQATVSLKSGEALFVAGHIITHSNKEVFGRRHSLVGYAPKETMSFNQNTRDIQIEKSNRDGKKAKLNDPKKKKT
jgi:hypothetical protein